MRLIVVRHLKTRSNAADRIIGWGDSPPADDWENEPAFVDRLLWDQGIALDVICSSDLSRSRRTADYYARSRPAAARSASPQLNEVDYGRLYKKSKSWVAAHVPEYKTDPDFVFPGGESFNQMRSRSVGFVKALAASSASQSVLLVVHAGVVRALVCEFLGLDYASNLKRKVPHAYVGEFLFAGTVFTGYKELGVPSDFVADGVVKHRVDVHEFRGARTSAAVFGAAMKSGGE